MPARPLVPRNVPLFSPFADTKRYTLRGVTSAEGRGTRSLSLLVRALALLHIYGKTLSRGTRNKRRSSKKPLRLAATTDSSRNTGAMRFHAGPRWLLRNEIPHSREHSHGASLGTARASVFAPIIRANGETRLVRQGDRRFPGVISIDHCELRERKRGGLSEAFNERLN